jgi:redox-sensitive bicupin YhaK (pirin superfamily)
MKVNHRTVVRTVLPEATFDGAGVKLKRLIASRTLDHLDPFLLLDHFGSENPDDYISGFPMHPHRGIETVTYMLEGSVRHRDTIGNTGTIHSGDIQWMTAGSGIMHEEMPQLSGGKLSGFQLWVNLPAKLKMTKPRYQEVKNENIPVVSTENGATVKVIAGSFNGVQGAVSEIYIDPVYLDVKMPVNSSISIPVQEGHTVFVYLYSGEGMFGIDDSGKGKMISGPVLSIFSDGNQLDIMTLDKAARFLLVSGRPLHEPIARYGPFVMNTQEEIEQTLRDLRTGNFGKS